MKTLLTIIIFALLIGCKVNKDQIYITGSVDSTLSKPYKVTAIADGVVTDTAALHESLRGTESIAFTTQGYVMNDYKPLKFSEVDFFYSETAISVKPKPGKDGCVSEMFFVLYDLYLKTVNLQKQIDSLKLLIK